MGLTSAVHWWEVSQMRVLVLSSLAVQFLLFIFSLVRRHAIPGWIRSIMWLAYLASDALAIYALATLFNRHKQDQDRRGGGSSGILEVVWAPVLLIHLGGHDGITAYNIEDNELWSRHLVTAGSQVTVAIYVFCKSWPGGADKRLLAAAILLFVPGVLKCFSKPLALKRASINSLVTSSSSRAERTAKRNEGEMCPLEEYVKQAKAFLRGEKDGGEAQLGAMPFVEDGDHPPSAQEKGCDINPFQDSRRERESILLGEAYKLFVDLSSPYPRRLGILKYFWVLREEEAYASVRRGMATAFGLLYTRVKGAFAWKENGLVKGGSRAKRKFWFRRGWILYLRILLPWAAIGLLDKSHREAYNGIDVRITYAIFCCTAVLEFYFLVPIEFMSRTRPDSPDTSSIRRSDQWPEMVAQYSLIGYFARNKRHIKMMRIVSLFGCKQFVDQRWCMSPCFKSGKITMLLVLQYLKAGWEEKIEDAASYRRFNDNRGHWALEANQDLGWSIKGPFDESVLLWHIATDFCLLLKSFSVSSWYWWDSKCGKSNVCEKALQCRLMSNYMMYLLFVNPEMLLPGTRRNLFETAYDELKDILDDDKPSLFVTAYEELKDILKDNERSVCRRLTAGIKELKDILRDNKRNPLSWSHWKPAPVKGERLMERVISTMVDVDMLKKVSEEEPKKGPGDDESKEVPKQEPKGGSFINDAWALAQGLLDLGDDKMWEVIQGVWVEMLCFSASRCRGYLHAKALGSGGEFLSYVWLLMSYMGMETLTERLQREELPSRQEGYNSASSPASHARNRGRIQPLCSCPSTLTFYTSSPLAAMEVASSRGGSSPPSPPAGSATSRNGTASSTPEIHTSADVHAGASPSTLEIHIGKV